MTTSVLQPTARPTTSSVPGTYRLPVVPAQTRTVAPCRSNDPELWFAESPAEVERAKSLCRGCPVRARCLDDAIARREPWGVWGGELLLQGVVVARKRPRGRPRRVTPGPEPQLSP